MLKTKTWAILVAVLLLLSGAAALFLAGHEAEGTVVEILQDGKVLETIDLAKVEEPYTMVIEDHHGGSNTVEVEPGRIRISEADCPDQICVQRGWLDQEASPIVCLPHRLTIRLLGGLGTDTVTQ